MTLAQNASQEKNTNSVAPPGRCSSPPGGSYQNQEQNQHLMCRLAAVSRQAVSGKNPETPIK